MKNESKLYLGRSEDILPTFEPESVDLIATDPPYGLGFMGKDWDKAIPSVAIWKECYRVLKPGAFAFVMSIPRQDCLSHMIVNLGDAGFDVSFSSIYWTYASGFPKAQNLSKQADKRAGVEREVISQKKWSNSINHFVLNAGHKERVQLNETKSVTLQAKLLDGAYAGFQPKPAVEIIIVAMKPIEEKTYLDQALKNGHGCTWLDDCRIPYKDDSEKWNANKGVEWSPERKWNDDYIRSSHDAGRFPANVLCEDDVLDDSIKQKSQGHFPNKTHRRLWDQVQSNYEEDAYIQDKGSFSRYFSLDAWFIERVKRLPKEAQKTFPWLLIPKPSKAEKDKYVDLDSTDNSDIYNGKFPDSKADKDDINKHPTIKPLKLMSWLIILGSREGDIVIDPFMGSGTTYIAATALGRYCKGIEMKKEYYDRAVKRANLTQKNISMYF